MHVPLGKGTAVHSAHPPRYLLFTLPARETPMPSAHSTPTWSASSLCHSPFSLDTTPSTNMQQRKTTLFLVNCIVDLYSIPDWDSGCRNADAGGGGLPRCRCPAVLMSKRTRRERVPFGSRKYTVVALLTSLTIFTIYLSLTHVKQCALHSLPSQHTVARTSYLRPSKAPLSFLCGLAEAQPIF